FSRAALAFEQHRRVGRRRALERREHLAERRILADELRRAAADRQLLFHQQVFGDDAAALERPRDEQQKMIGIDGLREEVHRAFFHRGHGVLDAAVRRHDDDGNVDVGLLRRAQHAEAVAVGKPEIGEDEIGARLLEDAERLGLIARLEDGVILPLQREPEHRAERVLVLDEKNLAGQRIQPGGTLALRASDSMSAIALVPLSISVFTRSSSASAFWRSSAICARWPGSSRLVKSAVSALMRVCSASANIWLRRSSSRADDILPFQNVSSCAGSALSSFFVASLVASFVSSDLASAALFAASAALACCTAFASAAAAGSLATFERSSLVTVLVAGGAAFLRSASCLARSPSDGVCAHTGTASSSNAPATRP